jgi:cell wall-associated NlpC family hydrolase
MIGYIRSDFVDLTEIPYENSASAKKPLFFKGGKSTGVIPSAHALNGNTTTADQIITTAKKYIGVPYVWGGSTPSGFDCSGFVKYVFDKHGIPLPRTAATQYGAGKSVKKADLRKGDLVFFGENGRITHVGIYMGDGNFIHASSSKGVTITPLNNSYWSVRYYGARRVLS